MRRRPLHGYDRILLHPSPLLTTPYLCRPRRASVPRLKEGE